jgi:spoIIIJ-associated protein
METYEFEGKTAEEAIEKASRELNIPVEELDIHIIEPGSAGIFGLVGSRKTKVRVNIIKEEDEDVEESDTAIDSDSDNESDNNHYDEKDDNGSDIEIENYSEKFLEDAKNILEKLLLLMDVQAAVTAEQSRGKINLNIEGEASGILIGRKGKTLDALEYLVNRIINNTSEKKIKVIVDSENYRQRHIDSLTELALKIGEKVKTLKKSLSTSPLNPHDRRIVHLALKNDEKLDTRSRGEGLMKKVVIIPKK